jgi:hypothetical protein
MRQYLQQNSISNHLFVKIDVEGYDEELVRNIIPEKKNRLISFITELHVDAHSHIFLEELSKDFYIFDLYYCPNPTRFTMIPPEKFSHFIDKELKSREFGYTDLFVLDKNTPDIDILVEKLMLLKPRKDEMVL